MSTTIPAIEDNWVVMQAATKTEEYSLLYLNQYTAPVSQTRNPSSTCSLVLKSENTKSTLEQHMVEEKTQTRTAVKSNAASAAAAINHHPTFTSRVRRQSKKTYKKRNANRQRRVTKQRDAKFQERLQINKLRASHFYNTQYCLMLKQQKQLRKEWEELQLEKYDDDLEDFLDECFVGLFCFLVVLFLVAIFIVHVQ